jgi:hypothetical protein
MTYKGATYLVITDTNIIDMLDLISPGASGLKFSQILDAMIAGIQHGQQ